MKLLEAKIVYKLFIYLWLIVLPWSLSDCKSPQISRTFLSILADLNNTLFWMIFNCPLISNSYNPFTKLLVNVTERTSYRVKIKEREKEVSPSLSRSIVFCSLARSRYLHIFSLSFSFTLRSTGTAKSTI